MSNTNIEKTFGQVHRWKRFIGIWAKTQTNGTTNTEIHFGGQVELKGPFPCYITNSTPDILQHHLHNR